MVGIIGNLQKASQQIRPLGHWNHWFSGSRPSNSNLLFDEDM